MNFLTNLDSSMQLWAMRLDFILRLIPRLVIGAVFIPAGWGKLQSMSKTIDYFQSLNIPLAAFQAPLVALLELICGFLIVIGLYTRVATLPLIVILSVAIATAHKAEFSTFLTLVEMNQGLYLVVLLCVFSLGSGTFSVEKMFFNRK